MEDLGAQVKFELLHQIGKGRILQGTSHLQLEGDQRLFWGWISRGTSMRRG